MKTKKQKQKKKKEKEKLFSNDPCTSVHITCEMDLAWVLSED